MLALLDQGAVALERAELAAEAVEAEALRRSDRLRAALLNSISHDLRTPLVDRAGLGDHPDRLRRDAEARRCARDLLESIREEAERLNRYVGDLLDMTRLEGGGAGDPHRGTDVRDVLGAAVERVARRLGSARAGARLPADAEHRCRPTRACWSRRWSTSWRTPSPTAPTARRIEVGRLRGPGATW